MNTDLEIRYPAENVGTIITCLSVSALLMSSLARNREMPMMALHDMVLIKAARRNIFREGVTKYTPLKIMFCAFRRKRRQNYKL